MDTNEKKINQLKQQVAERDQQILKYQSEMMALNERLDGLIQALEKQLQVTKDLQGKLTPSEYPRIQGFQFSSKYLPGSKSGGDYFDVFVSDDRLKFSVVVVSCNGYSVSALFLSVLLKYSDTLRTAKVKDPDEFLQLLLQQFLPHLTDKDEISLFYGVVDQRRYKMDYILLGGIGVLHKREKSPQLEELVGHTEKLRSGLQIEPLKSGQISIQQGDRIVIATEGLLKEQSTNGTEFGISGVTRSLKKAKISLLEERDEILISWRAHTQKASPSLDASLFLISASDTVIKLAE